MSGNEGDEARTISLAIIAFGVVVAGLVYGTSILIPLAVAIFFGTSWKP